MFLRLVAVATWIAACAATSPAHAADPLTLDDAFARVDARHPELRLLAAREAVLEADRDLAVRPPPLVVGIQGENVLGTGSLRRLDGAELTLTLASVLERGGKLDARRTLAQARIDALAIERETRRLDLLAEIARRYLACSAALLAQGLAELDIVQRQRAVEAARARWRAGASPEALALSSEAALARAELALARAQAQSAAARQHLAALWGEKAPGFTIAVSDLLALRTIPDAAELDAMLEGTPELVRFTSDQRIAEARVQLARASATSDFEWQLGVRALNAGDDVGLVAGLQWPLGAKRRADPELRGAETTLGLVAVEREGAALALYTTLAEAHGRYQLAQLEVKRLQDEVLPALLRAESAAERAWRAGASTYQEWTQLQSELTDTRRRQLEAAVEGHRALIEIQRLTGQPFVANTNTSSGEAR